MASVQVKICCIASVAEAQLAVAHGAAAVGLVSAMPSGPGVIGEPRIREIVGALPDGATSFLLTAETEPRKIVEQQGRIGAHCLQLVDWVPAAAHREVARALPGVTLVQVIHVADERSVDQAREAAATADALLLDSGRPDAPARELGGTGRVHNWSLSRRIVEAVAKPVWLAGGLVPENVGAAIAAVRPFGVDVCSGLRTGKALDKAKVESFFCAVDAA